MGPLRSGLVLLLATLVLGCDGKNENPPISTSPTREARIPPTRAGVSQTVTPSPTPQRGTHYAGFVIRGDFVVAEPVPFPENLLVIVETGCTQCDGPTDSLYRVWRNSGETHVVKLIDASISDYDDAYITSFALRPDLSEIAVTVCTAGDCGGLDFPQPGSQVTLYHSEDAGATWSPVLTTQPGEWLRAAAITANGLVVADLDGNLTYLDGETIQPPPRAEELMYHSRSAGELRWSASSGSEVLNAEGFTLSVVELGGSIDSLAIRYNWRVPTPFLSWVAHTSGPAFDGWYVTRMGDDYIQGGFRSERFVAPVAILESTAILGNMSSQENPYGGTIGYIDIADGVLTPIQGALIREPFGNGVQARGRNSLQAVIEGPFLAVNVDSCLFVREAASKSAPDIDCLSTGAVVFDLDETITGNGQTWRLIRLLDGREGWASGDFLTAD